MGKKIKYILNGGKSSIGVESTIIDLRKKPKILRLGGLEITKIKTWITFSLQKLPFQFFLALVLGKIFGMIWMLMY